MVFKLTRKPIIYILFCCFTSALSAEQFTVPKKKKISTAHMQQEILQRADSLALELAEFTELIGKIQLSGESSVQLAQCVEFSGLSQKKLLCIVRELLEQTQSRTEIENHAHVLHVLSESLKERKKSLGTMMAKYRSSKKTKKTALL